MESFPDTKTDRLLDRKELADRWGLSIKTLKRMEKKGILCPLTFSSNTVRYRIRQILEIEEDAAAKK